MPLPAAGAYFLMTDLGARGITDDVAFCRRLVTEIGVAAIPTSVFHVDPRVAPRFARFCFAKQDTTLREAAARLARGRAVRADAVNAAASAQIHDARVRALGGRPARDGRFVLYWMQQSQRASGNHALEYAIQRANALGLPLRVGFGLTDDYPEATCGTTGSCSRGWPRPPRRWPRAGSRSCCATARPPAVALELADGAAELVCDRGYLRHQRRWREEVARLRRVP